MKNRLSNLIAPANAAPAPVRRTLNRRGPAPLALEARIMFDGAGAEAAMSAMVADRPALEVARPVQREAEPVAPAAPVAIAASPAAQQRSEIVFIEDNVVNFAELVAAVRPGVEVVILDHTRDGLQQINDALRGHAPLDAIHLFSHGSTGDIELGSTSLSNASIDGDALGAQLAELGAALAPDADLLIYGCEVAAGDAGQALLGRIAALTGADVAASVDVTGSAAFGGNWTLERQHGVIEAAGALANSAAWEGRLAETTVYNANWNQLTFNGATSVIGNGTANGNVMRFGSVITIDGQAIDAIVTTTVDRVTINTFDSTAQPSTTTAFFQPNITVNTAGGGAIFKIDFYKAGTYTGAGTGTAVTLQNVVVNSYDIDAYGPSNPDRQYQQFKGFARYELSTTTNLVPTTQPDGSVVFQYVAASGVNSANIYTDQYRVKVYYDSMTSIEIKSGAIAQGAGTLGGTAYFALDFSIGPAWSGATTITGTPAANISYSATAFAEAASNVGAIGNSATITLANGSFSGIDGQALAGVTFSNAPAGLTPLITRTSATTASVSFTGQATAHANANDISNFGITLGNAAFASGNAAAVTGAARADLVVDFIDPPADTTAPVVASAQHFTYAENRPGATVIGTVAASDAVGVTGFRFAGNASATSADGFFSIAADGKLSLTAAGANALSGRNDYEATPGTGSYAVQARDAAGNWSANQNVTLALTNLDEVAPAFTSGATGSAPEAQNLLYTASAVDLVDFTNQVVTYSLKAATGDVALLAINGSSGAVTLASGNLDAATKASYGFTVIASDASGNTRERAVTLNVTALNQAPVAANTSFTTAEDTSANGSLPAASDADGDAITYSKASNPAHGSVTVAANGTYAYTPTANYHGADSFTYSVSDGRGGSNTYTVGIVVTAVNDAPVAAAASITTLEDTASSGNLPAALDVEGDAVTYAKAGNPAHGSVTVSAGGSYVYTPLANYHGSDAFSYSVSDAGGATNTYTINVTVTPVNDAPVAAPAAIATAKNVPASGLLPVASDIEGDAITYARASDGAHGSVTVAANGNYVYTPGAGYVGADAFSYTVTDTGGAANTYTVNVTVSASNAAPTAAAASFSMAEDGIQAGNLPAASDVDGDAIVYAKASDPAHGSVTVAANGSYTYTPLANYHGADSFSYRVSDPQGASTTYAVSITVTPVNDAPVAAPLLIATAKSTATAGTLPTAFDADGDTITYAKVADAAHGSVTVDGSGHYVYTPLANYVGTDSFSYSVSDASGASNSYAVSITVAPSNAAPVAAAASITLAEDTAYSANLPPAIDADGDAVTYAIAGNPAHGSVTIGIDGSYVYTPLANYHGADAFSYSVSDVHGASNTYTVAINVTPVNDAPVAAPAAISLAQDTASSGALPAAFDADGDAVAYAKASDPAHGSVTVGVGGNYNYTPVAGYSGSDSFSYTVSDGQGGSNTYAVSVQVTPATPVPPVPPVVPVIPVVPVVPEAPPAPANQAPTGADAAISTAEDQSVGGTLPVASDADGDRITYALGSGPAHGTLTLSPAGGYLYTPAPNYHGADSFTYTLDDGRGGSATHTVGITVTPVNDAPAAGGGAASTPEDTAYAGQLPKASDVDGDSLAYSMAAGPSHGTLSIAPDGSYTYTPLANYNGPDSFSYAVTDPAGARATYDVAMTVVPVNDAPVAAPGGSASVNADEALVPVRLAFSDIDSASLTYSATLADGTPLPAWLRFDSASATLSGTPPAGAAGTLAIKVTASDGALDAASSFGLTVRPLAGPAQAITIGAMSRDSGGQPADFITADGGANRSVSGTLARPLGVGESVQVSSDGGRSWITAVSTGTSWEALDPAAHGANWTIEARIIKADATPGPAAARSVILDNVAPAAPTAASSATASVLPVLSGSAAPAPGETVQVTVAGATYTVQAPGGVWTLDLAAVGAAPLQAGRDYPVVVTLTDAAGNKVSNPNAALLSVAAAPVLPALPPDLPPALPPAVQTATTPTPAAESSVPMADGVLAGTPVQGADPASGVQQGNAGAPTPAAAPAPALSPTLAALDNRAAPLGIAPVSFDAINYGRVAANSELASTRAVLQAAPLSDVYTRNDGFRTVVAKADEPLLVLFQGVPDQYADSGSRMMLSVPADAFVHTQANAIVSLAATLQDGRPLPLWVNFNAQTGQFSGDVPQGLQGELRIKLVARDNAGREATALFRVNLGKASHAGEGKSGLSEQLRKAGAAARRQ